MDKRPNYRQAESCYNCQFGNRGRDRVWCKKYGNIMCGIQQVCDTYQKPEEDGDKSDFHNNVS